MKRKTIVVTLFVIVLALAMTLPGVAQGPPLPGEVVIGDLGAPRGIAFDADGNLYIADAGTGGEVELEMPGPEGMAVAGLGMTGTVLSVAADGTVVPVLAALPSTDMGAETMGVYRAIPHGDSLWVVFSGTGPGTIGAWWGNTVVELDAATLATRRVINIDNFEVENDPDGNGYDSNIADIAWGPDGTLYIVDAGGNDLLSWTEADGLQLVAAWPDNPVPDAIEVAENGDLYIGFLGEALAPGAGKVEVWSGGELTATYGGLTAVTDILLDGDTLYAVQMFVFGEEGPGPGSVVMVDEMGATPVAEGLPLPFGLAMSPDGELYVSFGTAAFFPDVPTGVLRLDMGM